MTDHLPGEALTPWHPAPEPLPPSVVALPPVDSSSGGFSLASLVAMVRQHKLLIAAFTFVGLLAAGLFVWTEPPLYRANAVLQIGDARRAITNGIEDPDLQYSPAERLASPLLSEIELLRSRTVVGTVVDSVGLRLIPDFHDFDATLLSDVAVAPDQPEDTLDLRFDARGITVTNARGQKVRGIYARPLRVGGVTVTITARPEADELVWLVCSRDEAIDDVLKRLSTYQRAQTNVVDLAFTARRPLVAQRVVDAVVATYQSMSADAAQQQSRLRRVFLEEQLRQTDAMLSDAQLALTTFRQRAQLYSARDKLMDQQRDAGALDARREELDAERAMYQTLLDKLAATPTADRNDAIHAIVANPQIGGNPVVTQLYGTLARYQDAYDSLTTGVWRSSTLDPQVVRLRELIASSQTQLIAAVRSQLESMRARSDALESLRVKSIAAVHSLPATEAEEMRLQEKVETLQKMGDELRVDYEKARMAEAVEVGSAEIVDRPSLPYKPVPRLAALKLVLGLLLGMMLGVGAAAVREVRNTSIRRNDELERVLQIPGLASIPSLRGGNSRQARRAIARHERMPTAIGHAAEAYRILRTNLLFSARGTMVRSLVVTSAAPGEGKTLTAVNLASTSAREGMRVLLVDCDFRRPRIHTYFDLPHAPGLSDVLCGTASSAEAIHPTSIPGLSVLPAGRIDPRSAENRRSTTIAITLRQLSTEYDLVVLDTAPVLAFADASLLAALADGVLLVVRAGETDREEARRAVHQLAAVGANVLGAILNDPRDRSPQTAKYYEAYVSAVPATPARGRRADRNRQPT